MKLILWCEFYFYQYHKSIGMNKTILITGASSGMGKDFAHALLKKGHTVYGLARRVEKMQDIVQAGGKAIAMDIKKFKPVYQSAKVLKSILFHPINLTLGRAQCFTTYLNSKNFCSY